MQSLYKVISQSEPVTINTQNGPTQKTILVLQEMGGKYQDSYVASQIGAQQKLYPGDIVWVALRFAAREYNGSQYQDITVQELVSFTQH